MRWMLVATLAIVSALLGNLVSKDEAGLFELAAVGENGSGYRPITRREFTSRKECEGLAWQLKLTTFNEWKCNPIKESP